MMYYYEEKKGFSNSFKNSCFRIATIIIIAGFGSGAMVGFWSITPYLLFLLIAAVFVAIGFLGEIIIEKLKKK